MNKVITGYILRLIPYQESSAIIDVLTPSGLVSFKARGVLKTPSKLASCVQPYTYGEYQLTYKNEGGNATLTSATVKEVLACLFTSLQSSVLLALLVETIIKNPNSEKWYDVFTYFFNLLKSKVNYLTAVLVLLKYNTIYAGSYLSGEGCAKCGSKTSLVTVSFSEGGFICDKCNRSLGLMPKSKTYLRSFLYVLHASYENINDFEIDKSDAKEMILDFFSHLEDNSGIYFKCKQLVIDCL